MWTSAAAMILAISLMYASKDSGPLHVLLSLEHCQTTCTRHRERDFSLPAKASWPLTTGAQRSAINITRGSKMYLDFQTLGAEMGAITCFKKLPPNSVKSLSVLGAKVSPKECPSPNLQNAVCLSALCRTVSPWLQWTTDVCKISYSHFFDHYYFQTSFS